jgi:hypothetical protein
MKRTALLMLAGSLLLAASAKAQDEGGISLKPTPPPISCLDFFKGTSQFTFTGIYMKLGLPEDSQMDESPTGKGFNFEMSRGFADGFGLMSHFMFLGLNIPLKDPMTNLDEDYPASAMAMGATMVLDIKKGEKRDIAGEIIDKKTTVAAFIGFDFTGTDFEMENFIEDEDFSVSTMEGSLPMGLVADIPLNYYVSLVPFGRLAFGSTTVTTIIPYYIILPAPPYYILMPGIPEDSTYSTTRFDYGMDIDLRLFRNAPDWKISVGTVISQVEGMADGNLIIMASVKREWGKHYSSTSFGPKLH